MNSPGGRGGRAPLVLLGVAVLVGCIGLGAPPRMDGVEGAPEWARIALEALLPLAAVQILVLAAWIVTLRADGLPGPRTLRPLRLLLGLALLSLLPISWGFVAATWDGLAGPDIALRRSATLWPAGTVQALLLVVAVIVTVQAVHVCVRRDAANATRVLAFVALLAGAEGVYGIATTYLGDDTILGLAKVSSNGRVTGTFVMPSLLGALAVMGASSAAGLAAMCRRRSATLGWATVGGVCVAACVLTLSRWMVVSLAAGLVVTAWLAGGALAQGGRRGVGRLLRGTAVAVPLAAVAVALALPSLRERFGLLLHYARGEPGAVEPRLAGWVSAWRLFLESPLTGTGLGSFGRAIHLTQSVDAPQELWYAHCEPLNLLTDVGVVGLVLGLWWLVGSLFPARAVLRRGGHDALLVAAAVGGATGVLVAGLADFPTQFAVVLIPFAALSALPAALAKGPAAAAADAAPRRATRWRRIAGSAVAVLGIALLAASAVGRIGHATGGLEPGATSGERLLVRGRHELAALGDDRTPGDAYERALGAADLLRRAAEDAPLLDATHLWRGLAEITLLQLTSDPDEADRHREAALRSFGRARRVSRGHADVNLQIGLLYLDLLGTRPNPYGAPGDTAMAALCEAGALVPQAFSRAFKEALARDLPTEALAEIVPDRPHARRVWADHLRRLRRLGRADEADEIQNSLYSVPRSSR